jgi:YggT family protein
MSGLSTVGYFLISTTFGLITFILWLRFGLRYFRISPLHPVRQMVQRFTDPLFIPINKALQLHLTAFQRIDWICLAVLAGIGWLKFLLLSTLYFGHARIWLVTGAYTLADLISQPCDLLFYALLIRVIMSWVNPHWQHPLATLLYGVTEPLLQGIRQTLPVVIAGLDFSPFILMILLRVITVFVGASLPFHV